MRFGWLQARCIPPTGQRDVRDLPRSWTKLVPERACEVQRGQGGLERAKAIAPSAPSCPHAPTPPYGPSERILQRCISASRHSVGSIGRVAWWHTRSCAVSFPCSHARYPPVHEGPPIVTRDDDTPQGIGLPGALSISGIACFWHRWRPWHEKFSRQPKQRCQLSGIQIEPPYISALQNKNDPYL